MSNGFLGKTNDENVTEARRERCISCFSSINLTWGKVRFQQGGKDVTVIVLKSIMMIVTCWDKSARVAT